MPKKTRKRGECKFARMLSFLNFFMKAGEYYMLIVITWLIVIIVQMLQCTAFNSNTEIKFYFSYMGPANTV